MKHNQLKIIVAALFGASVLGGMAATTVLTFEGLQNSETVLNYYNGGLGGNGSGPGPNYGVTFSSNALALIDADAGGGGNFGGEPSPSTILFFLSGGATTLNLAAGFDTGFSFYYSAIVEPGFINVYDDVNAGGNLLATLQLPVTPSNGGDPTGSYSPFFPIGVSFQGIAKSVDFGGTADRIAFDNITFGSETPGGVVPEPANFAAVGCVLVSGLLLRNRRQRRINA